MTTAEPGDHIDGLKRLAAKLRNANGIERTPFQVQEWIARRYSRPSSALGRILRNPDAVVQLAEEMRDPFIERGVDL